MPEEEEKAGQSLRFKTSSSSFMLPQINRIKKKKDFEKIFKNSKSFKSSLFIFRISKNDLGLNRFGFVVSQKVSKKAVIRNKVRRRLAEIMRAQTGKIKNGTDLVIIALPIIGKKEFVEIRETTEKSLIKCDLLI